MERQTQEQLAALSIAELDAYFAALEAERIAFRQHARAAKQIRDTRNRQANELAKSDRKLKPDEIRLVPGVALASVAAKGLAGDVILRARKNGLTKEQLKAALDAEEKAG